jgi:hypothetical protein
MQRVIQRSALGARVITPVARLAHVTRKIGALLVDIDEHLAFPIDRHIQAAVNDRGEQGLGFLMGGPRVDNRGDGLDRLGHSQL